MVILLCSSWTISYRHVYLTLLHLFVHVRADENTSIEHTSKEQKNHIFNFLSLICRNKANSGRKLVHYDSGYIAYVYNTCIRKSPTMGQDFSLVMTSRQALGILSDPGFHIFFVFIPLYLQQSKKSLNQFQPGTWHSLFPVCNSDQTEEILLA